MLAQQAQDRAGLPGVRQRGEHHAGPRQLHACGVEQHPAAGNQDEPQQGLEDVGVHDMARARQQRTHLHRDALVDARAEVGAERPRCSS